MTYGAKPGMCPVKMMHAAAGLSCLGGGLTRRDMVAQELLTELAFLVEWHSLRMVQMVSINGGTPKSSILIGFSLINQPYWGCSIYGSPPTIAAPRPCDLMLPTPWRAAWPTGAIDSGKWSCTTTRWEGGA